MRSPPPTPQCTPTLPARSGDGGKTALPRRISSEALLAGGNELLIEHRGLLYRLRQTSLGKLILTK